MGRPYKAKRLRRFLRRNKAMLDRFAETIGLELCDYTRDCNFCDDTKSGARSWVKIIRGLDFTEVDYNVCDNCLPDHYKAHQSEMRSYNRSFERWVKQQERQRKWERNGGHPKSRKR